MFPVRLVVRRRPRLRVSSRRRALSCLLSLALTLGSLLAVAGPSEGQAWTATWTQKADPPPGPRAGVDMAFDTVQGRAVLFGGPAAQPLNDVWQYDTAADRWLQLEPAQGCPSDPVRPTARVGYALEYDPLNQSVWIFGGVGAGCNGSARIAGKGTTTTAILDQTLPATGVDFYKGWTVTVGDASAYVSAYNPTMKMLTLATPLAGARWWNPYFLYPPSSGRTFSYSPATRSWGTQTGAEPATRLSPAMAYSSRGAAIVMFGGQGLNDTWALDLRTKSWMQMIPSQRPGSPPGLAQVTNAMAYDSDHDAFILFGGCLCAGDAGPSSGDTWAYKLSSNTWTRMTPAVNPPPRQGHNLVYDSANKAAVLFGGFDVSSGKYFNDLWVYRYDTNSWTQVFPSAVPTGRRAAAMVYDPIRQRTILYGGSNPGSLQDVWALQLQSPTTPSAGPTLTSLSPNSATAGDPGFTLTVTGANFAGSSVVQWMGSSRPTSYVRSTQLQASIPASDVASARTAQVSVTTGGPGGGTSGSLAFAVASPPPAPSLTSISPTSAVSGSGAFTLTATGSNFASLSVLRVNGSARPTTVVSATQLTATIPASDIAAAGTPSISVFTPAPGGGTSAARTLTVSAPSPAVSASNVPSTGTVASPTTLSLVFNGMLRDRVGQGVTAISPDGLMDGTLTATLSAGRTITALRLDSDQVGTWVTRQNGINWVLGVAPALDGSLLNAAGTMAVNFPVSSGGSFVVFAADYLSREFVPGAKLTLVATFSDGSTASASTTVVAPASPGGGGLATSGAPSVGTITGSTTPSTTLSLVFNGMLRDRVGQGVTAISPDGLMDGTLTATLSAGRTITALRLDSDQVGTWVTRQNGINWVLGVAPSLDGSLLNAAGTMAVNFPVSSGGSFVVFAADYLSREFVPGAKLTLVATFSDGSTASASTTVVAPASPGGGGLATSGAPSVGTITEATPQAPPPAGTWATISKSALFPALPPEATGCAPPQSTNCSQSELWSPYAHYAYSGGDLATINGVLGLVTWGGGHADSPDNSLMFAPLDGSPPRRLSGPYLVRPGDSYYPTTSAGADDGIDAYRTPSRNQPGLTAGGAPKARHTYACLTTIQHNGKPHFFTVGGAMASRAGFGTATTRLFDLTQTYAQAMARDDMGWAKRADAPEGTLTCAVGWDSKTGLVIVRARGFFGAYDPMTNTWARWGSTAGGSDYEASSAIDVEGRKMYVLGTHVAEVIDLDAHTVTQLGVWDGATATGPAWVKPFLLSYYLPGAYGAGPGLAWHAGRKRLLVYSQLYLSAVPPIDGTQPNVIQIDPVTGTVETLLMRGLPEMTRPGYHVFGRFRLIPGTDTVVLAGYVDRDLRIGQLPASGSAVPSSDTGTATGPASSSGSSSTSQIVSGSAPTVSSGTTVPSSTTEPPSVAPTTIGTVPSPGTVWIKPGDPIPVRQWVERLSGANGGTSTNCNSAGTWLAEQCGWPPGKHSRTFYHPGLKGLVGAGGDRPVGMPHPGFADGTGTEIILYRADLNTWTVLRPFCVPGAIQPQRPDNVIWAVDAKRNRAIMAQGFYFGDGYFPGSREPGAGGPSGCGATEGYGSYVFDFTTKTFSGPDDPAVVTVPPGNWGGDTNSTFGVVDAINDELVILDARVGLQRMNLGTKTWRTTPLEILHAPNSQTVIDQNGRALYYLAPYGRAGAPASTCAPTDEACLAKPAATNQAYLVRVSLDSPNDGKQEFITLPWPFQPFGGADSYLAFDPINRVVFVPNNISMGVDAFVGLGIYHVDTGVWEWEDMPKQAFGSLVGFDENIGALALMGKRQQPYATYLYKYGGNIKPLPVQPLPPVVQTTSLLRERFDKPNGVGLGPEQPWTMVEDRMQTIRDTSFPPGPHAAFVPDPTAAPILPLYADQLIWASARVEKDLPSADMEVWMTIPILEGGGGYLHEVTSCVTARFSPTAATYYAACIGIGEGRYVWIAKVVNGVRTILGFTDPEQRPRFNDQPTQSEIRLRVTGSGSAVTVTAFYRGKVMQTYVDTAPDRITQNTRAGLAGQGYISSRSYMDDWRAGVAAVTP